MKEDAIMRLSWRLLLRLQKAMGTEKHVTMLASPNRVLVKVAREAVNVRDGGSKDCRGELQAAGRHSGETETMS